MHVVSCVQYHRPVVDCHESVNLLLHQFIFGSIASVSSIQCTWSRHFVSLLKNPCFKLIITLPSSSTTLISSCPIICAPSLLSSWSGDRCCCKRVLYTSFHIFTGVLLLRRMSYGGARGLPYRKTYCSFFRLRRAQGSR